MDHATSPRIRRAHPARGNNRPRQRVGHQGRAHTDRGRMVRALRPPHDRSPRQETKRSGGGTHRRPLRGGGGVASTTNASTPDGVTFRQYGPAARFDHHHPADPPVVDTTGRRILCVGEHLATSACEVFGDAGIAAICPNYRVAIIAPTTKLVMYDLAAEGAAMAIGALPALSDGKRGPLLDPAVGTRGESLALWDCDADVEVVQDDAGHLQDMALADPCILLRLEVELRWRQITVTTVPSSDCNECRKERLAP
jgi:hypothetical protein